ncbi:FUSC family protein [Nocardioides sp. CN2-186]|uniref:FUSC family protein n=1 Tax=Nocardioides tweenelious TaxID=3156607 RepID=UPI0032B59AB3
MRDQWRGRLSREVRRLRNGWRGAVLWSLRITVAAVTSYVVATLFFPGTVPLLAPLTAMLVVQVTPVSLLASGVDRVVAVVTGVSLAVAFAAVVPLEWWSLGALIFVSITVGQALRLQSNLLEVAISGMLVLGVGSLGVEAAAGQRIAETLVGAAVGVAANLLFPPRVPTSDAGREIEGLADSISDLLRRSADALEQLAADPRSVGSAAEAWLGDARLITQHDVPRVGAALLRAEQGRRLNVRAAGTPDLGPGLRHGLESLEHTGLTVRSMYRALADATAGDHAWLGAEGATDVLLGLVQTFREMAAAVDAFGELVRLDAAPAGQASSADFEALREAMEGLPEARARLEEMSTSVADADLRELHAAVLSTVKRVQRELDLEQRVRRQLQLRRPLRTWPAPLRPHPSRRRATSLPAAGPAGDGDAETVRMPRLSDGDR